MAKRATLFLVALLVVTFGEPFQAWRAVQMQPWLPCLTDKLSVKAKCIISTQQTIMLQKRGGSCDQQLCGHMRTHLASKATACC
jgi:hypothetical protein